MNQCERSALAAGWFQWFGVWYNAQPWNAFEAYQPSHIIGTARDVCLLQGLKTGDTAL